MRSLKQRTTTLAADAEPARDVPPPPFVRIATLGGLGNVPWAPGTVGSAAAVACVALFDRIPFAPGVRPPLLILAAGLIFGVGVWTARQSEDFLGRHDPPQVVIDEFAGQLLAFVVDPTGAWELLLAGFVAFRIFDVWKPFPARQAERLRGGWGIMVDDVVAGAYALIIVSIMSRVLR